MADDLQKKIVERCQKREKNILDDLDEYYGDNAEWKESSSDLVKYAIFYNTAFKACLEARLLFGYDLVPFTKRFLDRSTDIKVDKENFKSHHYNILSEHYLDKALVELILKKDINKNMLEESSAYHFKFLNEYEYSDDISFIKSGRETIEAIISTSLHQMIVNKLLDMEYSDVIKEFDPTPDSPEKLWLKAWQFAYQLYTYN